MVQAVKDRSMLKLLERQLDNPPKSFFCLPACLSLVPHILKVVVQLAQFIEKEIEEGGCGICGYG